jgi:hypothetical protein
MLHPERILPLVPDKLPLALVDGEKAFLSIVALRCRDVHLAYTPFPRLDYYQLNVRTYVIDPHTGNQAVYFFKSGVTSLPVSTATRVFSLKWQHIKLNIDTETDNKQNQLSNVVTGEWESEIEINTKWKNSDDVDMSPFISMESAVQYLVRPLIGFYRWGTSIGRFEIRHPEVYPVTMHLNTFRFMVPGESDLLRPDELLRPHSVLFVPEARFSIYLPPERMSDI